MGIADKRRLPGWAYLLLTVFAVVFVADQYVGVKEAVHDFERGFQDGIAGR